MAQYLKIHPENPQQRLIDIAVTALQRGELVIYPTDTTYAIACQLGDKGVLQRLISLRRLDSGHQFTLACKDLSELGSYARVENSVYRLLKRNTPGPFTFLLPATKEVPKRLVHPKKKIIGLRVPDHPVAQALLSTMGEPLLTTTFRLPGEAEMPQGGDQIREQIGSQVAVVIDGGHCGTESSTVVDLTGREQVIIRQGVGELH